ncbi:MAG TPA: filamentous hemagglutinin N-terminal domain-containing protein, partial [Herbaspirillum sp.]
MNQQRYRIIFSKSRGQCIVVAETARSHGGASSAPPGGAVLAAPSSTFGLRLCRIAGLMLGAMGLTGGLLASGAAMAQIVADPGAPGRQRPTVVNTANGTLQVNIQTPSAAGVSRNSYSRFDVPNTGVVLNNSRLNTQSQLGGAVQANPWLTAREARVILNEVNSTSPSQLRGFIEVAGSRAEVIIANPAGINVDGGGFINVSRATLTTGTPILNAGNGGSLDGYTVDRGQIGINGAGLDARQTDYAMLIARSVAINAGIWAQQLAVTAGANQVGIDQASMASPLSAAPIGGNGAAPQYGIDVSQLGGMYANKIVLLGTEAGVGVHNAGSIGASAGEVIVTSEGRLENSGGMAAKLALQINAKGDIDNSGSLSAETAITLAGNAVANSGTVAATDSLTVSAAGSLQNSGTLNGQNAIRLSAGSLANQGIINSAGQAEIDIQGAVSNVDGTIQGQRIALSSATAGIDNQRGKITQTAMADLDLTAAALVNTGGGIVGAPAPAADNGNTGSGSDSGSGPGADGGSASPPPTSGSGTGAGNTDGNTPGNTANNAPPPAIVPSGYIRAAGAIGNDGGTITAGGTLAANVAALDNSGGNLNLRALRVDGGGVINRQGGINVTGDLTAGGNAFDNQGGKILVGGHLQGNAGNLDNRSGAIQADRLDLTVAQDLDNTSGSLRQSGSQDMLLKVGGTFDNQDGSLETPGNLALQAASVTGDGGKITALGNLQIDSGDASVRSGAWVSGGNATINTAALDNHAGTIAAGGAAAIHADGVIDNSLGTIQTAANLDLQAAAMLNNDGGVIAAIGAAGNLQAQAAAISNIGGKIVSDGNLDIHAGGAVDNTLGILHGGGNTQLSAGAALTNDNGIIEATGPAGTLGVSAGSIASDGGRIVNIGSGLTSIASAGDIANAGNGVIAGNGAVDVRASSLHNNAGGTIASGADLTLGATQALVNLGTINSSGAFTFDSTGAGFSNGGQIASGGNIVIAANAFDNIGGSIETGQGSASDFSLTSQSMNNALGHIVTDRDLSIRTQQLGTAGGLSSGRDLSLSFNGDALLDGNSQLHANRDLNLTLTGTLTNTSTLAAVNTLTVSAGALDNVAGGIIEAQNIALTMPGVLNNAGQINGAGNVTIAAGEIDNSNSIVGGDLVVSTQNLNNTGAAALIGSTGNMSLWIAGQLNNADGATIYSAGSMAVAGNAARTDGVLVGRTAVINNTGSTIEAAGDLEMAANTVNNIRSGVAVDKVTTVDETTAMHTASWWTNGNNNDVYSPHSSNFDANEIYYVNPADIIEDGTYITPDGYTIGRAVIKTHANDSVFFSGVSSHFNTFGETDRLAGSDGTQVIYYLLKQDNQSNPDQVAGTDGGLETSPGTWNALPSFSTQYGSCSTDCIRLVAQYDYTDPTTTILRSTARYLAPSKEALEASRTAHHVAIDDVLSPTAGTEARIQSGGNMRISVDQALNNQYASIMAGGGLQIDGGTTAAVSNVGETLYRTHTFDGTWYTYGGSAVHYDMPSISEVIGSVGGVMSGNQGVAISGHSFSNVDVSAGTAANIRSSVTVLGSGANGPGLGGSGAAADVGNAAAVSQANGTGATVKVSASGLFEQSQSGDFLFATRSAFTRDNAAAQTSSDFFLNALGIDPNAAQKRIGDGYYEQEMVRDQMAELTGRVTGSANDDSQYKALMTAGVGFAEQWNLTPGIALTADQVAHLTSDIVWMESETVVLPDGTTQTVLAPKVYLAHVDDDAVKTNGALVTGDNVIISAGDIVNKGGLIDGSNGSGDGRTILLAANDISNLGGSIQGDNIALNAGGDIRNETLAVTETHADGQVSDSFTSLSNQATIAAGDSLLIQAGRDVVDIAGQISAGLGKPEGIGDVQISAGRDISLSTVQTGSDYTAHTAGYSDTASSVVHQSSQLAAGGDLTLSAGQDIALSGAQLAIGVNGSGSGVLVAGRDLSVTAVTNQSNIDAGNDSGAKGYNRLTSENQTVVGTHIAASDDLTLKAGAGQTGDLALTGSGVAAGGDVTLAASGDVAIQQAMETHQWDLESHNSSKGFLSSSSSSSSDASNKNLVVGSSVSGNSVSIVAGNDIAIGASQITAQHDLGLVAGHDLTISSAAESDDEKHAHEESKSGFSASLMSGISYGSGSQNQSQTV